MTRALDTAENALINAITDISDDVERYQAVRDLEARLAQTFKRIKADTTKSLHEGRSWNQVGQLLGITGSRAEQVSRSGR